MSNYQICTKTVMDTSDSRITIDSNGVCDHATDFYANVLPNWRTGDQGFSHLSKTIEKINEQEKFKC